AASQVAMAMALAHCFSRRRYSVSMPRMVSHASKGLRMLPEMFWLKRSWSASGLAFTTTRPAITSVWPARYLEALCITISAPIGMGCCSKGVHKVLSTTSSMLCWLAILLMDWMSDIFSVGLVGDSSHIRRVRGVIAADMLSILLVSVKFTFIPKRSIM